MTKLTLICKTTVKSGGVISPQGTRQLAFLNPDGQQLHYWITPKDARYSELKAKVARLRIGQSINAIYATEQAFGQVHIHQLHAQINGTGQLVKC